MLKWLLSLLAACFGSFSGLAQPVATLRTWQTELEVGQYAHFFVDTSTQMTLGQVLSAQNQVKFKPAPNTHLNFGSTPAAIWLKFNLDNQLGEPCVLGLANPALAHFTVFQPQPGGGWSSTEMGAQRPFAQRPLPTTLFKIPLIEQPGPQTYYVRLQSDRPVFAPLTVSSYRQASADIGNYNLGFGLSYGLAFIIILYNLLVYRLANERLNLVYAINASAMLFILGNLSGHVSQWLWPNWPTLNHYIPMFNLWASIPSLWFASAFFNFRREAPKLYRLYLGLATILFLAGLVNFYSARLANTLLQLLSVLWTVIMMATATWFIWRQRGKGWLFLLARGAYLTSVIALVLIVVDVLPYWKGSLQLLAWGAATEMLLLTLAVASKVSEYRTRLIKAQEQQLVSARLNEEMARQSAEVLEQRVAQRTQELQASEQRLLAQNEELLQTQEELLAQRDLTEQNQSYLHLVNSRLQANEAILKKAYDKSRASQEKLRAQNEQILAINQKIEQSLQVAQTIQQAILPFPAKKRALLGDYFVFLRPRDVVSGDFFWLNQVDGWTILAVLDCTGHGVPGAFMSLIANTLLDKIVKLEKMVAPQQILTRLNQEIVAMLRQDEGVTQSSMDACICAWRPDGEHFCLEYAGAKRPLYYLPPGEEACLSLLPDRMSIGGAVTKVKTFTGHQLRLPSGSLLYLSTDGFADQNDAQRKRYGSANFVKLLSQISQQPMAAQREALQQALHHYTRHTEQRDDILVIGVHLNQTELPA